MKNANDFVKQKSNYSTSASSDLPFVFDGEVVVSEPLQTVETTIEDVMTTYNEYLEKTKRFKEKQDKIEAILGEDRNPSYHGVGDLSAMFASLYSKYRSGKENMSFNERWRLYCVINGLLHHDMESVYTLHGTDLRQIWGELRCFTDIENYLTVMDSVKSNKEKCRGCLCDEISFDTMYSNGSNIICSNVNHFFVRLDDELKCPFCSASTKEYNLTKEQLDFLTECAMAQNKLIKIITKDDMPLVQVLVHEEIDSMEAYDKELSQNQGSFEDQMFHHYDFDESVSTLGRNITKYIERAHKIDSGDYTDKWGNQSYFQKQFDDETAKKLLDKVNQDLESARTMSLEPESRRTTVRKLKTKKYEILILAGNPIPELYDSLTDEEDRDCFVKAYNNLNDEEYRKTSGYFEGKRIAGEIRYPYACITAHPGINKKLLEMKLKLEENICQDKEN